MKKEIKTYVAIMIAITTMVIGMYLGYITEKNDNPSLPSSRNQSEYKLNYIWSLVKSNYVDNIDNDSISDRVYTALLSSLDPHSSYLSKEMIEKSNESLRGNFEGVGITIRLINDTVNVMQVIPGGPSEEAGVLAGDRIISVDGVKVSGVGMSSDSVVNHLRGRRKSIADIQVIRLSDSNVDHIRVKRDIISTPSLTYSGMLDKKCGYIRLSRFGETTYYEFVDALKKLQSEGMKELILDLRDNGGGLLSAAIDICDELLPGKEMIVYTEGLHQRRKEVHSSRGGLFASGKLTVIIDEYSASASEIVAGAIQDNDRGTIVGRRSFGKGLVQQQFDLPDKSAIMLTIARYYTPSGRCIQRPYNKGNDEYYNDFLNQIMNEIEGDSLLAQVSDSTPYYTAKGRVVYGGGGILPDHIIHYKTDENIRYYNLLLNNLVISDFVQDYVSHNATQLKKRYTSETEFLNQFSVGNDMLEKVFANAEKKGIPRDNNGISHFRNEMRARIKAEIGDMLFSSAVFYKILLPYDRELLEIR